MNTKIDFVKGKTSKCLMFMFLPVMAAMFLNMAYNVVDSLWIGNLLGEKAYAALTSSTPIVLILCSIAMGSTNGVAILVSQAIGAKDKKRVESTISTSFTIAVVFSIAVSAILELLLPSILRMLNTPKETFNMAYAYLSIYLIGYTTVFLYCYFTAVLRSFGNAVFQMIAMLICTILNAVLDPIFMKMMNFNGAAVATVLSQSICLIIMIVYLAKKRVFVLNIRTFDKSKVGEIIKKSVPSAFQQSIPAISTSFLTSLISSIGISAIAAYGVTGKLETILFYPAMAFNMVLTNIIGQCAGACRWDRARDYIRSSLKTGIPMLIVLSVLVVGFAKQLSGLFLKSSDVAEIVRVYFMIVSIGYILNTVTNCYLGAVNGLGNPGKSMMLMVLYYIIVRMPLSYVLLNTGFGLNGIWSAILISHVVAAIAAALAGNRLIKKQENEIRPEVVAQSL